MLRRFALMLAFAFAATPASTQTLTNLTHQPPDGAIITMQMTDGTVIAQGGGETDWWKLTPDNTGSYLHGTWSRIADLPAGYSPYAQAEAVLADGRLIISGGEYNFGEFAFTNLTSVYDPATNTWTMIDPPAGWTNIGDSPEIVLADGRFVLGYKFGKKMAALDPKTLTWSPMTSKGKNGMMAEEGFVLLPDGSFLSIDVKSHPLSERYVPETGKWESEGSTGVDLRGPQDCCGRCIEYGPKNKCYDPPGETGAAVRRPDGTVFATGAMPSGENTAHTAIWTPPTKGKKGKWTAGPDFPNGDEAFDDPVSILPNGNVLAEGYSGQLYEFDGKKLTREPFNSAGGILMPLPSGEVMVGGFAVYKSTGTYDPSWAPTISASPKTVTRGQSYQISGTQFNGLNQGAAYGDEFDTHTNFPLVRITNNASGHVFYAKTHDHSSMGVATGSATIMTNFDVPAGMESGASMIEVVANGIPSTKTAITVN